MNFGTKTEMTERLKKGKGTKLMCLYKNKNEIVDDLGGRNGFKNAGDGKFESSFCCI